VEQLPHTPPLQLSHTLPHAPQLFASFCVFTHSLLQRVKPGLQSK
jgi:hypothetical protein